MYLFIFPNYLFFYIKKVNRHSSICLQQTRNDYFFTIKVTNKYIKDILSYILIYFSR